MTERDRKLKPGWKVLVGGLCTLAMLLECTNVVLSSRKENKDHTIDYEMSVPRVLPVRNDTMCAHGCHPSIQSWPKQQATHGVHLSETSAN